jgi:DNA-binding transcriptional ArsR family regulator
MTMAIDPLSAKFSALADPTRRAILARLALGETSVTELAVPFDMSLPAVSKHLKVLENAGLITRTSRATARLSHLRVEPLRQGLRELGYSEGSSIIIEWRRAKDREDLAAPLAFELVQRQVDLIVTVGTSAARAALDIVGLIYARSGFVSADASLT